MRPSLRTRFGSNWMSFIRKFEVTCLDCQRNAAKVLISIPSLSGAVTSEGLSKKPCRKSTEHHACCEVNTNNNKNDKNYFTSVCPPPDKSAGEWLPREKNWETALHRRRRRRLQTTGPAGGRRRRDQPPPPKITTTFYTRLSLCKHLSCDYLLISVRDPWHFWCGSGSPGSAPLTNVSGSDSFLPWY